MVHTLEIKLNDQIDMFGNKNNDQEYDAKENISDDPEYFTDKPINGDNKIVNQPKHQCEFCEKSFSRTHHLYRHVREVHEGRKDYKCETCGKPFSEKNKLKFHVHTVHEGYKAYECDSCGRKFTSTSGLKGHFEKCDTFIKKACDECGKLVEERLMDNHKTRVHIKPHKCEICGRKFGVASVLKKHVKKHAEPECGAKEIKYDYCQWTTKFKSALKKHFESKHTINVDEHGNKHIGKIAQKKQCDVCYICVINLEVHKGRKHAEKEDVKCDSFGKQFDNRQKLKDHVYGHHKKSKKILKCNKCGKIFNQKYNLEYHVKIVHDQIKEHQCETCGAAYSSSSSLKVHIQTIHLSQRLHKCDLCGKAYKMGSHLKTHKKQIHDRIFDKICTYCGKAFSTAPNLKMHSTIVHEGIKKWKCDLCSIAYGQSHQLKKHYLKTHGKIYHISRFGASNQYIKKDDR